MELSLLAERLPAETALAWGMINRVVDDPDLPGLAMEIAQRLAEGPASLTLIRKMYWAGLENSYEQQLGLEAKYQMQAGMTEDYNEGVTAFREKRRARFSGV
jgi:2-(1,2-epoxy-1,2-dihydrophenyl)acetyl-CoA isomerase